MLMVYVYVTYGLYSHFVIWLKAAFPSAFFGLQFKMQLRINILPVDTIFPQLVFVFYGHNFKRIKTECSSYGFVWCFLVLRFQLEYYIKDVVSFAGPPIWRLTVPICSHWHLHRHLGDQPGIARGPSPASPFLSKGICSSVASIPPSWAFHP